MKVDFKYLKRITGFYSTSKHFKQDPKTNETMENCTYKYRFDLKNNTHGIYWNKDISFERERNLKIAKQNKIGNTVCAHTYLYKRQTRTTVHIDKNKRNKNT